MRKKIHLTQKQLASKVNVSAQVISNWERGYSNPDHDDVLRLAEVLDTSSDYLLGRTDDPSPTSLEPEHQMTVSELMELDYVPYKPGVKIPKEDLIKWKELLDEVVNERLPRYKAEQKKKDKDK